MKFEAPHEESMKPVLERHPVLRFPEYLALWSSLGVGLLVLLAGPLLVPGPGLKQALPAILIGSVIGSVLLAIAGIVDSDHAMTTMVRLRPVPGIRGLHLPTVLNVIQLIGWGASEVIIVAQTAKRKDVWR